MELQKEGWRIGEDEEVREGGEGGEGGEDLALPISRNSNISDISDISDCFPESNCFFCSSYCSPVDAQN